MTMTATPRRVVALANGVATTYSFGTARIFAPSDIVVTVGGVIKTLGSDYTISSGNIIFGAAPASGLEVEIKSQIPLVRDTDFAGAGRSTPAQLDADIDKLTAMLQEAHIEIARLSSVHEDVAFVDASEGDVTLPLLAANDPTARITTIIRTDDTENIVTLAPADGTIMDLAAIDLNLGRETIRLFPRALTNNWHRA